MGRTPKHRHFRPTVNGFCSSLQSIYLFLMRSGTFRIPGSGSGPARTPLAMRAAEGAWRPVPAARWAAGLRFAPGGMAWGGAETRLPVLPHAGRIPTLATPGLRSFLGRGGREARRKDHSPISPDGSTAGTRPAREGRRSQASWSAQPWPSSRSSSATATSRGPSDSLPGMASWVRICPTKTPWSNAALKVRRARASWASRHWGAPKGLAK